MMELDLKTYHIKSKLYRHNSKSIVATEKMMMKNSSETFLEKAFSNKGQQFGIAPLFHVQTFANNISKGSATEKLTRDMNTLVNDVVFHTDATGKVNSIVNKNVVLDKWESLRRKWKKEATKEERDQVLKTIATVDENIVKTSFDTEIAKQGAFHFLFAGLYGNYQETNTRDVKLELDKFLVTQPLPLKITYTITQKEDEKNARVIEGKGVVDEEKLNQEELQKLIRILKDKINLKVDLQVAYKERYVFDEYHWLQSAEQQVQVKIPGFYMTESKQEIIEIDRYEQ